MDDIQAYWDGLRETFDLITATARAFVALGELIDSAIDSTAPDSAEGKILQDAVTLALIYGTSRDLSHDAPVSIARRILDTYREEMKTVFVSDAEVFVFESARLLAQRVIDHDARVYATQ